MQQSQITNYNRTNNTCKYTPKQNWFKRLILLSMPGKGKGRDPICCSMAISISNLIDDTGAMTSCMMTLYSLELKTKVKNRYHRLVSFCFRKYKYDFRSYSVQKRFRYNVIESSVSLNNFVVLTLSRHLLMNASFLDTKS